MWPEGREGGGNAPPDRPVCGFRDEKCASNICEYSHEVWFGSQSPYEAYFWFSCAPLCISIHPVSLERSGPGGYEKRGCTFF